MNRAILLIALLMDVALIVSLSLIVFATVYRLFEAWYSL